MTTDSTASEPAVDNDSNDLTIELRNNPILEETHIPVPASGQEEGNGRVKELHDETPLDGGALDAHTPTTTAGGNADLTTDDRSVSGFLDLESERGMSDVDVQYGREVFNLFLPHDFSVSLSSALVV